MSNKTCEKHAWQKLKHSFNSCLTDYISNKLLNPHKSQLLPLTYSALSDCTLLYELLTLSFTTCYCHWSLSTLNILWQTARTDFQHRLIWKWFLLYMTYCIPHNKKLSGYVIFNYYVHAGTRTHARTHTHTHTHTQTHTHVYLFFPWKYQINSFKFKEQVTKVLEAKVSKRI